MGQAHVIMFKSSRNMQLSFIITPFKIFNLFFKFAPEELVKCQLLSPTLSTESEPKGGPGICIFNFIFFPLPIFPFGSHQLILYTYVSVSVLFYSFILFFQISPVSEIIQYLSFQIQLISFNITPSIHVVANGKVSVFMAE